MTLNDLLSRVGSSISVHSPVFQWIVEHATDILNKCHVASDGKSALQRLKSRQHRGMLLPFGTVVMCRVVGKVPGGVMTERWHLGTWLGKRFHTKEHIVALRGNIEAASRTDPVYRDHAERAEQRKNELIIQGEPRWNRVSCLNHQLKSNKVRINQVLVQRGTRAWISTLTAGTRCECCGR